MCYKKCMKKSSKSKVLLYLLTDIQYMKKAIMLNNLNWQLNFQHLTKSYILCLKILLIIS